MDRKRELDALRKMLGKKGPGIIVLYGRRRVGKTRLVLEAVKGIKHVYYLAVERGNLQRFKTQLEREIQETRKLKQDWEVLIEFLDKKVDVLVFDEFPNMISEDQNILGLMQSLIDTRLKNLKIVLTGSTVSIMTNKVLSYKSPLYGRRIGDMKLLPMSFFDSSLFFPKRPVEELVEIYGLTGGIPLYAQRIEGKFWDWLDEELKDPTSFIKYEVDFLLRYEFEDITRYKAILEAIANGKITKKEISDYTGSTGDISPYLNSLLGLDLIKREIPIMEKKIRTKKTRYYLKDNFLKFWFRFIGPNLTYIEEGTYSASEIKKDYAQYIGPIFEDVSRQYILELVKKRNLPSMKVGRQWGRIPGAQKGKNTYEIDIVGIPKEGPVIFGEAKWKDGLDAWGMAKDLMEKIEFAYHGEYELWLFGKSFKRKVRRFDGVKVRCVDLKGIEGLWKSKKYK